MDYHHVRSEKCVEQIQRLFCKRMDGVAIEGDTKVDKYLQELKKS